MAVGVPVKKAVRSGLLRFPRVHGGLTSQARYRLLHRLGLVHEADFRLLAGLVDTPDPLVLDVGGNIGQSVLSILTVLPGARVITFEPHEANLVHLRRLAEQFPAQLTVEACALGSARGEVDLHWPVYGGRPLLALASVDRTEAAEWLGPHTVYGFRPERLRLEHARVAVRTLDELDLAPDVIKIDVQGLEDAVLQGGARTVERHRPVVLAESLRPDLPAVRHLLSRGYRLVPQPHSPNSYLLPDR